jgi:hypothetical protein
MKEEKARVPVSFGDKIKAQWKIIEGKLLCNSMVAAGAAQKPGMPARDRR